MTVFSFISFQIIGNVEVVELLIKAGANVNAINNESNTPLHISAKGDS